VFLGNSWGGTAVTEKDIEKDERGANGDGGIGDVEGGVVIGAEPHFEEIRNRAVNDAVGYVAGRSAEKKREAGGGQGAAAVACNEQPGECGDDHNRDSDQGETHPGRGRVRENTKCDARIAAVYEIDKMMDQLVAPALGSLRFEPGLGGTVSEDHGEREPEPAEARRKNHEILAQERSRFLAIGLGTRAPRRALVALLGMTVWSWVINLVVSRKTGFDFGEGLGAALADSRIAFIFADVRRIVPAALAFRTISTLNPNLDMRVRGILQFHI
jgi:hypothetical protein